MMKPLAYSSCIVTPFGKDLRNQAAMSSIAVCGSPEYKTVLKKTLLETWYAGFSHTTMLPGELFLSK